MVNVQPPPTALARPRGERRVLACEVARDVPHLRHADEAPGCDADTADCTPVEHGPAKRRAACRLTVQDGARRARRYWEVAPSLFRPETLSVPRPCPFASDPYQLMRNLAFASQ